jgi:hypothetical protein
MNSTIKTLLEERVSANWFDAARSLNQQQIEELVRLRHLPPLRSIIKTGSSSRFNQKKPKNASKQSLTDNKKSSMRP